MRGPQPISRPTQADARRRCKVCAFLLFALVLLAATGAADSTQPSSWTKKSFAVEGTWQIVKEGEDRFLVLSDDFKTRSAPDLKLFLSTHTVSEAGNRNATEGSLLIAPLRSNRGGQRYALPENVDLDQYSSVLLHCEQYSKLWAASALPAETP